MSVCVHGEGGGACRHEFLMPPGVMAALDLCPLLSLGLAMGPGFALLLSEAVLPLIIRRGHHVLVLRYH